MIGTKQLINSYWLNRYENFDTRLIYPGVGVRRGTEHMLAALTSSADRKSAVWFGSGLGYCLEKKTRLL